MRTNPPCSIANPAHRLALCLLTGWAIGSEGYCAVTFTPVGSDSEPFEVLGLSRNGEFALGYTVAPNGQRISEVAVWHAGTLHLVGEPGTLYLGNLFLGQGSIADDGTFVGWHDGTPGLEQQVWRYDAPSDSYQLALNALPDPPIGTGHPEAISADASTIVGTVVLDIGVFSTVVWHAPFDEAPEVLGGLGPNPQVTPFSLSATGAVIVGWAVDQGLSGFRTLCTSEGLKYLQYLEPIASAESHVATSVSPDSTAVAGYSFTGGFGNAPQSWLLEDGVTTLLPFDVPPFEHLGLSTTGQVIVGRRTVGSAEETEAVVWTQAAGARTVQDILADAGIEVSAAQLQRAVGISGDGQHIAGHGTTEAGKEISWIVDLGQPSDIDGDDEGVCNILDGDFDIDGDVDGIDLMTWQQGYGLSGGATFAEGDADADGNVDGNDFLIWQRNVNSLPEPSSFVPEPSSIALITLGLFGVAFTNWRPRQSS